MEAVVQITPKHISDADYDNRTSLSHLLRHKYILLAVVLLLCIAPLKLTFPQKYTWESQVIPLLLGMCNILIAIGIVHCLWIQYRVYGHRWILYSTVAFICLVVGQLLFVIPVSIRLNSSCWLGRSKSEPMLIWQSVSAYLFAIAVYQRATDARETTRKIGIRKLLETLAFTCFVIIIGRILTSHWSEIADRLPHVIATATTWGSKQLLHPTTLNLFHLFALVTALIGFTRRYSVEEDAIIGGIIKYLILATNGQFAALLSSKNFDLHWWLSHWLFTIGLLVLITRLATEFGRSYSDAHAHIDHLEAVHHVSSQLSNTLDLRVVLLTLVAEASSMLSARFAAVMLADSEGETLTTVVTHGIPEDLLAPTEPQKIEGGGRPAFYSGHTARAFREKRICVVDDVYTDVEFIPWRILAQYDGYTVSIPLIYHGLALGVLNLFFENHVPLNDERVKLFETLASAASVAIVNAQLYEKSLQTGSSEVGELFSLRMAS